MKRKGIKAVTLVELLMAIALTGIVVVGGSAVIRSAFYAQKQAEGSAIFSLAEASQGAEATFQRLVTAQNFNLLSSSDVQFTYKLGVNTITGRIYKSGTQLLYQADTSNPSTAVLLDNVKTTAFSKDSLNRVVMEIALNDSAQTTIRTAARTRNPYEARVIAWMRIN